MEVPTQQPRQNVKVFEWKWVALVVGLFIVGTIAQGLLSFSGMFSLYNSSTTVDGVGVINETPDQYQFVPAYQAEAAGSVEATAKVTGIGTKVIDELKKLGVSSDDLSISVSSNPNYGVSGVTGTFLGTYNITALVSSLETARAVTAYLASTSATGSISPYGVFSADRRSELELAARAKAIENAKEKATQTAAASGKKLGKLLSIYDSQQYGGYPTFLSAEDKVTMSRGGTSYGTAIVTGIADANLLQTGKQEIRVVVSATYHLR